MTKEIYISSTPHETRLAVVEDDLLAEIYYERENEYTLAGSVYKGKVTRVLPGMQSAFVEIGLERDAFLYVTDFAEEQEDGEEYIPLTSGPASGQASNQPQRNAQPGADSGASAPGLSGGRQRAAAPAQAQPANLAPHAGANAGNGAGHHEANQEESGEAGRGTRRWRGRRGRRRGRGAPSVAPDSPAQPNASTNPAADMGEDTAEPLGDSQSRGFDESQQETAEPASHGESAATEASDGHPIQQHPLRSHPIQQAPQASPTPAHTENARSSAQPAPLILPGESLSKYRRGPAEGPGVNRAPASGVGSTDSPATALGSSSKPSTIVEALPGWDGGGLLPGESLSRYKKQPLEPTHADSPSSTARQQAAPTGAAAENLPAQSMPIHADSSPAAEITPDASSEAEAVPAQPETTDEAQLHSSDVEPTDFEPAEASASYRFDPEPPSTYRQSGVAEPEITAIASQQVETQEIKSQKVEPREQTLPAASFVEHREPPVAAQPVEAAVEPGAETLPASPEPVQAPEAVPLTASEPFFGESLSIAQPHPSPEPVASPEPFASHEHAPETASVEPLPHTENNLETGAEPSDDRSPFETEEDASSDGQLPAGQISHAFDPGQGLLEEEMIDEEEADSYLASTLLDESGYDDLIEETLDVQMDSGLLSELVRDQHIDLRTRFTEEPGTQEDEFEDEEGEEEGAGEEVGEIEIEEDSDADAEDDAETTEVRTGTAPSTHQRQNRRGNKGQRQGGDRRRMRRSTAQTTNMPAITELLKPNQEILVQIAKEPIARKGARITSHIALPGRFLVFMPTVNHVGVSRKISSDEERQRLKRILLSEKGAAAGGFIVRTAAATASEEDLRADIRFLLNLWAEIRQRAESSKPPALIYHDLSLVERVLRDQVTDRFSAIWVDSEADYERVLRFLNRFEPSLVRRVKLYTKETPLFEQFGIQEEINKALRSKVWLKSGGSIVINQTEALVAIDINTGKYVGKTARLEDTILKTNLDAIPEIVRQIRLRDLGGIIVIDFIDMDERKNRHKVMLALEEALRADRAPSKVLQFNDFGLVAITRKRVKQSLERTLSVPCSICTGTGMVKGPLTVCNEIYIELRKMNSHLERGDVLLRVNPEVVKQLKANNGRWLTEMEELSGKTVIVKSDPTLHPEQFDIH